MSSRARRKWKQLTLDDARQPSGRGGWRPGAGRPRGRTRVAHRTREDFAARYPQHVTVRVLEDIPSLRRLEVLRILHEAVIAVGQRDDFRVVEFNVLTNHLHFVIEAGGALALASGMKALKVRLAKRRQPRFVTCSATSC
jgi:REP element-mobilizing transposase RayT